MTTLSPTSPPLEMIPSLESSSPWHTSAPNPSPAKKPKRNRMEELSDSELAARFLTREDLKLSRSPLSFSQSVAHSIKACRSSKTQKAQILPFPKTHLSFSNKTLLQEVCAKNEWAAPKYSITKQGPDHIPQFSATVVVNDVSFVSQGFLRSKKEAEASAAGMALEKFLGYQIQQPISPNVKSLSSPVKVGPLLKVDSDQTWSDTNITPKKKGADEVEQLLAQERMLWQNEKLELELKNLELATVIDVKSNEIQQFEKKLQHMKEMATMEQKKTERMISLVEEKEGENKKLHMKVAELEKQLQAVSGGYGRGNEDYRSLRLFQKGANLQR